jgi:hypothetical protein
MLIYYDNLANVLLYKHTDVAMHVRICIPLVKAAGNEAVRSPPYSAEVKTSGAIPSLPV